MIARLLGLALASALLVAWSDGPAQDTPAKAKAAAPRPVVQAAHIGHVRAIGFDPTGKVVATASADATVKLWHVPTGRILNTLAGHQDDVGAVAFSPDGTQIATGSAGRESVVWITDTATGRHLRWIPGPKTAALAYSHDGHLLAIAGDDHFINVHDPHTGERKQRLTGHHASITCLAFFPGKKHLLASGAGGGKDHSVKLWHANTGKEAHTLAGHKGGVTAVAFSPDGKVLATAGADRAARLWDVDSGKLLATLPHSDKGKDGKVVAVGFADRKTVVTVGDDKTVRLWDAAAGKELGEGRTLRIVPHTAAVSPDGTHLVVAHGNAGTMLTVDVAAQTVKPTRGLSDGSVERRMFHGLHDRGYATAVSPDGRAIASSGHNTIALWKPASNRPFVLLHGLEGPTFGIAFSPNSRFLASVTTDDNKKSSVRVWDAESGKQLAHVAGQGAEAESIAWSPDGKTLASASRDKTVRLWHVTADGKLHDSKVKLEAVKPELGFYSVAFSPDGKWVAGGQPGRVAVWDAATGKLRHRFEETKDLTWYALAFSLDSKHLAGGHEQGNVRVWDMTAEKPRSRVFDAFKDNTFPPPYRGVCGVAFSPDGKTLAAAYEDHRVRVWDVASAGLSQTLYGHAHAVRSVAFTREGDFLMGASGNREAKGPGDGLIKLWARNNADAKKHFHAGAVCTLVSFWDEAEADKTRASSWVVYDSHGRYDAARGGDVWWLHWVLDGEPVELWQLKERYYEPHLLAKHLGLNAEPVRKVSDAFAPKPAPRVEVKADPKAKSATVTVTDGGGGVGAVRVLVNGKEVSHKAGPGGKLTVDLKDAPLTGTGDKLRVVAWNAEGDLSGRGVELDLEAEAVPKRAAELHAIVVGVSAYQNPKLDLRFAAKDAADLAAALQLGGERKFPGRVHLTRLHSGAGKAEEKPTKANIHRAFEAARAAHPEDVFVVFLAGHGLAVPGSDLYCYLTAEAASLDPKAYADPAVRGAQAVSSEELVEWIKQVKALHQVMVLDTCAAGQAAALVTAQRRDVPSGQVRAVELLKDRTGFHVLMGCAADRVSYEANRFQQGLLTYALLHGMQGPGLRDNDVDVVDWFRHAWVEVPKLAEGIGGVQQPIISSPRGSPFSVGTLNKTDQAKIVLPQPRPELVRPRVNDAAGADPLGLEGPVRAAMRDPAAARGAACAYRPSVIYTVNDKAVAVTINLLHDGKIVHTLAPIAGTAADLAAARGVGADALRKRLARALDEVAGQLGLGEGEG